MGWMAIARILAPVLLVVGLLAGAFHKGVERGKALERPRAEARGVDRGRAEQAAADTLAFIEAQRRAEGLQAQLHEAMRKRQDKITEKVDHDHAGAVADIDRAAADKLRRQEARRADQRRAGSAEGGTAAAAAGVDHEAYCQAAGWIPFGRALSMAVDAEKDAAQARACAAWVTEQAAAWPDE